MPAITRQWHLRPHNELAVRSLAERANIVPAIAALLLNRDIHDVAEAQQFLNAPMTSLHPPQLIPGIPEASERILKAVQAKRKICIYGDYDVDGTTGTAVLLALLAKLGAPATFYIPDRLEEGYGLNSERIRALAAEGVSMLITVDCGISSIDEALVARELGIELIITDHHEMKPTLPDAAVLVHPRLPGSQYPFGGLSGSCVAFKLAWAIATLASGGDKATPELRELLIDAMGIAALGLVADVVPLRDENRVFVRHGLKRLVERPSVGIRALLESAKLGLDRPVRAEEVSFRIAPRINAAGRLGLARFVVELLTTNSPIKAREIAEYLEEQNTQRQGIERKIVKEAKELVEAAGYDKQPGIVLGSTEWHSGVVGIVAGRLAETYGKPVLLAALKPDEGISTGSGRSISGFALHEALRACDDCLIGHGGHAAAAGFKLIPSNMDKLREKFNAHILSVFPDGPPPPRLMLDSEMPFSALTLGLMQTIDKLEPYGAENPKPRFLATGLQIEGTPRRMGTSEQHLSFKVKQGGTSIRAVAFGFGDRFDDLMSAGGACSLAFTPKVNEWQGRRSVELEVIDFQAGEKVELH